MDQRTKKDSPLTEAYIPMRSNSFKKTVMLEKVEGTKQEYNQQQDGCL